MASDDRGWSGLQVATAFVLGALAGAAATWLMTTPSGRRQGERAREAVKGTAARLQGAGDDLRASLRRAADAARAAWNDAVRPDDTLS